MLMRICREQKPEHIANAFDLPAPTFRHTMFPQYQAHRPRMPDDLQKQMPVIKEIVRALRIPILELEGYEADDILATFAKAGEENGFEVYVFSKDKDCLQMVNQSVKVLREEKDIPYDIEKVRKLYGVEPSQLVEVMALSGDSSDNIPGVPGIGTKTAARLIQEFGSLENLLTNIDSVRNTRIKDNLRQFSNRAKLNKELVTLDSSVPLPVDFNSLRLKEPDRDRLSKIFWKLEFKKLLETI
jgi:DNA polymerase-1